MHLLTIFFATFLTRESFCVIVEEIKPHFYSIPIPFNCVFHIKLFSSSQTIIDTLETLLLVNSHNRIPWTSQSSSAPDLAPVRNSIHFRAKCVLHILLRPSDQGWLRMANYMSANHYTYESELRSNYIVILNRSPTVADIFSGLLKWPVRVLFCHMDRFKHAATWFYFCAYCIPPIIEVPANSASHMFSLGPQSYSSLWRRNIEIYSNWPRTLTHAHAKSCPTAREMKARCAHNVNMLQSVASHNNVNVLHTSNDISRNLFGYIYSDVYFVPNDVFSYENTDSVHFIGIKGWSIVYCDLTRRATSIQFSAWVEAFEPAIFYGLLISGSFIVLLSLKDGTMIGGIFNVVSAILKQNVSKNGALLVIFSFMIIFLSSQYENDLTSKLIVKEELKPLETLKQLVDSGFQLVDIKQHGGVDQLDSWSSYYQDFKQSKILDKLNTSILVVDMGEPDVVGEKYLGRNKRALIVRVLRESYSDYVAKRLSIRLAGKCFRMEGKLNLQAHFCKFFVHIMKNMRESMTHLIEGGFERYWLGLDVLADLQILAHLKKAETVVGEEFISLINLIPLFAMYGGLVGFGILGFIGEIAFHKFCLCAYVLFLK
ncbi:hypothetical protein Fcan01_25705 [Folsomia candida]|uniref:Uncharacterized protein n=1 Tax=Folsomia candida TaxID=158441 RepID=A0A226D2W3_FOLCA|nr:hypothetical protein Fcan01_25705 [Folsomia candida]